ncbi:hypothetical protein QFC21_006353 [Naganishia friedmannii]|uniref:Uncharacterized protein n=1 Tax=Naganishia friedmannii TaxID=89922 RepID=A0ACC2V2D9_9TREE|nr:hypothetical protein QFC21_006353 [Naganishia friedmannii]
MLEINGIADALEGLDFAEEDEETEHNCQHEQFDGSTSPHSTSPLRGFRQLPRVQGSGPPVNPFMGDDVRKGDGSPGSIPPEVWELVVAFLLDGHDLRSAARLNRTSRAIHGATLPRLWKVVFWRVQGKGTDFVESDGWTELVGSTGFQYIRFLTFEMDDPSSDFEKIESHPAMRHVRAILFTTPSASYRRPRNHSTTGFNAESIYHCRHFKVFLLEGYRYASSDVFGLLEALGKGRYHEMTVVPCSTLVSALPDGDDDDLFTASLVTTIHHRAFPAPSAMPLAHLDSVSLELSNVSDEAEWQWNQCSYAVLEILRIKAYSA